MAAMAATKKARVRRMVERPIERMAMKSCVNSGVCDTRLRGIVKGTDSEETVSEA